MPDALDHHTDAENAWPRRWAVALVCATFPLIWVGGLVTTYDAGMAVPDWPNTYGYNLFLYPWQTWLYGPWGLFIEHGHRLLGSLVGMLSIALVASAWWCRASTLVRWLSVTLLAAVVAQGVLGGVRVIADEVLLARVHGCFGPVCFALAVAIATITSRRWNTNHVEYAAPVVGIARVAILTTLLAYGQLVLGSLLRHLPAGTTPGEFRVALVFHLVTAAVLVIHVVVLAVQVGRGGRMPGLRRPTAGLVGLMFLQIVMGSSTWVTKYGWPNWLDRFQFAAAYVISADGRPQAWITTAHVALGSLILVTSLLIALRAARLAYRAPRALVFSGLLAEAVL